MVVEMGRAKVGLVMGSASDLETMEAPRQILEKFGVEVDMRVLSAHRTPTAVVNWVKECETSGVKVIIAAAGLAAHLAGAVAANTLLPVIGVPMDGGPLRGIDALLSTVQMPKGTPVATVAIGKAGAANAALFALRIIAVCDGNVRKALENYQVELANETLEADRKVRG